MNGNDETDDRMVNNSQLNGCTSKEESDLILRIRRTILHLDEDDRSSPKKETISTSSSSNLSSATLEFKIERAKQKFAAGSLEEAFYECWKIPQEQRPLEIWKLGGECCKKLRVFAVAQRWFSEAIHVCRSNNTDLNVKLEQARIARFFNNYLTQYPAIDIRVDQRGKGLLRKNSSIQQFDSMRNYFQVFTPNVFSHQVKISLLTFLLFMHKLWIHYPSHRLVPHVLPLY